MPNWKDQLSRGAGVRRGATPPSGKSARGESEKTEKSKDGKDKGGKENKDDHPPGSQDRKRKPSVDPVDQEGWGETKDKNKGGAPKDLIAPLAKLTLAMALQMRQFEAHLRDSYQLESSSDFIKMCNKAGDAYFEKVKELGKGHGLGAPYIYIAQAGMEVMALNGKSTLIQRLLLRLEQEGPPMAHMVFTHFQVKLMYDETKSLIKVGYQGVSNLDIGYAEKGPMLISNVRAEINKILVAMGAVQLLGPAPRGELERIVQAGVRRR